MASYQDDELQTLGDILPRMKPLPDPPPGASEDELAQTQQHNDALAQLQNNALFARYLAQNTITQAVPFPDSLVHFVPGNMVGPLAAARAGGDSNPWTDSSATGLPNDTADPWASYAKSAFMASAQNSNVTMPPQPASADKPPSPGWWQDYLAMQGQSAESLADEQKRARLEALHQAFDMALDGITAVQTAAEDGKGPSPLDAVGMAIRSYLLGQSLNKATNITRDRPVPFRLLLNDYGNTRDEISRAAKR